MKKIFGIIITIFSYLISAYSVLLIAASEFDKSNLYNDNDQLKAIGIGLLVLGVILFTFGLFMTASKSKKQIAIEMELSNLKYLKANQ